jgi:hypothetical protein
MVVFAIIGINISFSWGSRINIACHPVQQGRVERYKTQTKLKPNLIKLINIFNRDSKRPCCRKHLFIIRRGGGFVREPALISRLSSDFIKPVFRMNFNMPHCLSCPFKFFYYNFISTRNIAKPICTLSFIAAI